jgi:glutaredoxin
MVFRYGLKNHYNLLKYMWFQRRHPAMQNVLVYSTNNCPNCRVLKQLLEKKNIPYKEVDMATPAALTELNMNGVFAMSAPVLQIGNKFHKYDELFKQDRIDIEKLESLLKNV